MPDPYILVETPDQPDRAGAGVSRARRRSRQRHGQAARVCRALHHREQPPFRHEHAQRAPPFEARRRLLEGVLGRDMRCGETQGDIRVGDIPMEAVFPDPAVRDGSVQDGQYVDYVYRCTRCASRRCSAPIWRSSDSRRRTCSARITFPAADIRSDERRSATGRHGAGARALVPPAVDTSEDGETIPAGAVACSCRRAGMSCGISRTTGDARARRTRSSRSCTTGAFRTRTASGTRASSPRCLIL